MKRKKLFCMILSIAMVFTTMDLPAAAAEVLTETTNVSEETSVEQESTTTQQETTKENETEQESVRNTTDKTESETEESITLNPTEATEIETEEATNSVTEATTENETEKVTETITDEATEVETEKTTESATEETTTLEDETEGTTALETETEEVTEITTEETTDSKQQDTKLQVSYHTTDEILEFLEQENAVKTDKITYKEEPSITAPYKVGSLSSETLDSAAAMIRQIRFIAGLPHDISLNEDYNDLSQSAALVNYVNNDLSHEPSKPDDMSEKLFQQGSEGASNSNIAFDGNQKRTLNETLIDSWMADKDGENISQLENRSRILNPSMEQVGFGAISGSKGIYSAMYATDHSGENESIFGIAWPAQNMPIEYFGNDYPWSISTNETLKASEIGVTLTRKSDGKKWNFSKDSADGDFYVHSDNSAQKSSIIFRPETSDITAYEDEDSFQVEISKNKKPYISYTVHFFSITEEEEILTAPEASISSGEAVAKESTLILTSKEDATIYYTLDGTTPSTDSILYTEPISIEEDITVRAIAVKEGYTDSDIAEFIYTVIEDAPLRYNITFESNGGTIVPAQSILESEKIELPEVPVKEGYLFEGWFKETECENIWDFEKETVTADITLYAKWTEDPSAAVYTVSFELQEHGTPIESLTVKTGELLTAPEAPTADGYQFEGWFKEPECTNAWDFAIDTVLSDTILYAKWTEGEAETETTDAANTCLVTFNMQGIGAQIDPVTVNNGETFAAPDAPTADGYTFAEWYREAECINAWNFETDIITEDIVLYAKWIEEEAMNFSIDNSREASSEAIDLEASTTDVKINNIKSRVYNGKAYEPAIKVTALNGTKRVTLKKDKDYTLKYQNNVNASTDTTQASVTITGKGAYKGSVQRSFTITPKSIKKLKVITGSKLTNGGNPTIIIYDGTTRLNNSGFLANYINPEVPKKAKLELTAKENTNYTGSVTVKLTVYDVDKEYYINSAKLEITGDTTYTGKAVSRNVKLTIGNTELRNNKDYKVQYQNNTNVGTAVMSITGKGKYKGKFVGTFNIGKIDINKNAAVESSSHHVTIANISPKTYNGKAQKPTVTIRTMRNKKLALNKDYTVAYSNNIHSGTALITIRGIGNNCAGSTIIPFTIKPQHIKKATVKLIKGQNGAPNSIALTYNKKTLQEYADYVITQYGEIKNKKIPVTIEGRCDFTGDVTKTLSVDAPKEDSNVLSSAVSKNMQQGNYSFSGSIVHSYLFKNDEGLLTRVEYVGKNEVCVETYSSDFKLAIPKRIKMELPKFGGFYAGKDYYFLAFGQENPEEDNNVEVIRIVKYDKNWNRQGAARIFGANTYSPFKNGSLRMVEYNDTLYIRTCHQMYKTYDGNRHQASAAFSVSIPKMEVLEQIVGISQTAYVSHSFNQFLLLDDSDLLALDHGDAYPRSIALARYNKKAGVQSILNGGCNRISVLQIQGKSGNPYTGVSVGGFEASDTTYLTAGNSVEQNPETYSSGGIRNIFVTSTKKDDFSANGNSVHWITNHKYIEYTDVQGNLQKTPEANVLTPHLIKINNNEMMLMWSEVRTTIEDNKPKSTTIQQSILLNGSGEPISGIYSFEGPLSDCKPIVDNGNIIWYYTNNSEPVFCTLNIDTVRKQPR